MATKSMIDRLRANLWVRIRLSLVSPGARWVWQELVEAMMHPECPGSLQIGSDIGFLALVSRIADISETQAETHVAELLDRDLLVKIGDTVALPGAIMVGTRKAIAARINGMKGGRPRKDGVPRQQTNLMLPMDGGRAPTSAQNPTETQVVERVSAPLSSRREINTSPPDTVDDWVSVAEDACEAARLDRAKGFHQLGMVKTWMQLGATRQLIMDVITEAMGGWASEKDVWSLKMFDGPIRRELKKSGTAKPAYDPREEPGRQKWREAVDIWERDGMPGPVPELQAFIKQFWPAAA